MLIGVPKEIKTKNSRRPDPDLVREYIGTDIKSLSKPMPAPVFRRQMMTTTSAGAKIVGTAKDVFDKADMIVKVKEPQRQNANCCAKARSFSPTCTCADKTS